jgi:metal-responsive CopG/Arc/MetJ family transcriptional regulator
MFHNITALQQMAVKAQAVGISFPRELLEKIDRERGDVSRSRFILRMLEEHYDSGKGGGAKLSK